MSCKILGIGSYLPGEPVTNFDLSKIVDTNDEWIRTRTGILQRYFADESLSSMAYNASVDCIKNSKIDKSEIDLVIVCTTTPDRAFPSVATTIQGMLGLKDVASFDLNGVCSGFIYGLQVAKAMMQNSEYKKVLLIGADKMSSVLDMKDRSTAVLFGDGAGAIILEKDDNNLFDNFIGSDGASSEILMVEDDKIFMKGQEVYKYAVVKMHEMAELMLKRNSLKIEDVDFFVPHQANIRIIESIAEKLNMPKEKVITTVSKHANTSAATIPLALDDMRQKNMLKSGQLILMAALGAGVTFGGSIIRY